MFRDIVVFILCMALGPLEVFAQAHKRNYELQSDMPYLETYLQDLPSPQINNILEDSEGFIWVSTKNGVARFDGVSNTLYADLPGERDKRGHYFSLLMESEDKNAIVALFQDGTGFVEIDKVSHVVDTIRYHERDGSLVRIPHLNSVEYNDSLILTLSTRNLRMVRKQDGLICASDTLDNGNGVRLIRSKTGVFVAFEGSLFDVLFVDGKFSYVKLPLPNIGRWLHAYQISDTIMYAATFYSDYQYHFFRTNLNTYEMKEEFVLSSSPKGIVEMDDGLWIATNRGVYFYSFSKKSLVYYTVQNSQLPTPHMTSICKSKFQPIIWFGTQDGLVKNDYYSSKFSYYDVYEWSDNVDGDAYEVIKDSQSNYWMSVQKKLYWRRNDESKFEELTFDGKLEEISRVSVAEDTVNSRIYLSNSKYILEFDREKRSFKLQCEAKGKINSITFLFFAGKLVWAEKNLLYLYDNDRGIKKQYEMPPGANGKSPSVTIVKSDGDSLLWIISERNHLSVFDETKGEIKPFARLTGDDSSSPWFRDIQVMYRNGHREIWLLSGEGLYYYLPDRDKFVKVEYSPFFASSAQSFAVDADNNLWVGSEYGIACINNTDGRVYEYSNQSYRLPRKIQSSCVAPDGRLIMSGISSFVEFSVDNFASNSYFPTPRIVQYQYQGAQSEQYDSLTLNWIDELVDSVFTVPAGVRSVNLNVRVTNYSKSEYNTIQWRIEGEKEWRTANTMTPLILSNLKPGISTVEMRTVPTYTNEVVDMPVKKYYIKKEVFLYEEIWFAVVMWVLGIIVIITVFFLRARMQMLQRLKLQAEVDRQTSELQLAYENLSDTQKRLEKQNQALTELSASLESQVRERTEELEKEKSRIEEGSKLKSVFLANLSHEVRTPMNCIVGFSKLLADPSTTKEESLEFIHLIKESASSLLALLGDLLDVSRIESGQMRVNIAPFPVMKDLYDIYKMLQIEKKNKTDVKFLLNVSSNVSDVVLNSDRDRFKQIIINLVYNAFKFTEHGHVAITASVVESVDLCQYDYPKTFVVPKNNNVLLMSVEDTGIGMPEDKLDVIFEPFRKLNNNKTLYPGLGLGLNICKNLIQLLGGQIWVKSVENMGTTFLFYIPISDVELNPEN